jgi:polar amino acid transport system substrate-binding protein
MLRWELMRAAMVVFVVAGLAAGQASSGAQAAADRDSPSGAGQAGALKWAADAEGGAPYIFKDPDHADRNIGFEVELIAALAKELRGPIEFTQYQFSSLVPGLMRGDFDFAMNGIEVTPDRIKALRLSRPYYVYTLQLVARKDEARFQTLDDCKRLGAVVGTLEDTAAERLLLQKGIRKKVYGNQVEPYLDLGLERIDAVFLDLPIAIYYARPDPKLKFVGKPLGEGFYAIAFRKDQEALAKRFDAALGRLLEGGQLRKIYQKWNLWNGAQAKLADFPHGWGGPAEQPASVAPPPSRPRATAAAPPVPAEGVSEDVVAQSSRKFTFSYYIGDLLAGAELTVLITFAGMGLAMVIGLPIALARLYGPLPLRWAAMVYVEFFRGIPVLLLLFFIYYGLPTIAESYHLDQLRPWLKLGPLQAAILGFGLNYAAYQAEIFRAGIHSIPPGQWEAAASLGMSRFLTFRRIIMPQAVRVILPPMTNDFVALFKDTSVVSIIAVEELTKQYQELAKSSLKYLEIGLVTAVLYLIMSVPLGYLSRYLEQRWGKGT